MRAKQLILLAEWFDAEQALSWGLINQVVPLEKLRDEAANVAGRAAKLGQNAIRLSKEVMHKPLLDVLENHMDVENRIFMQAFSGSEAQERFVAKMKQVNKAKSKL